MLVVIKKKWELLEMAEESHMIKDRESQARRWKANDQSSKSVENIYAVVTVQ